MESSDSLSVHDVCSREESCVLEKSELVDAPVAIVTVLF